MVTVEMKHLIDGMLRNVVIKKCHRFGKVVNSLVLKGDPSVDADQGYEIKAYSV